MSYLCFDLMIGSQPGRFHGLLELETRGLIQDIQRSCILWSGVGGRRAASRAGAGPIWAVGGRADAHASSLPAKTGSKPWHGFYFLFVVVCALPPCHSNFQLALPQSSLKLFANLEPAARRPLKNKPNTQQPRYLYHTQRAKKLPRYVVINSTCTPRFHERHMDTRQITRSTIHAGLSRNYGCDSTCH